MADWFSKNNGTYYLGNHDKHNRLIHCNGTEIDAYTQGGQIMIGFWDKDDIVTPYVFVTKN